MKKRRLIGAYRKAATGAKNVSWLDLHGPAKAIHREQDLWRALTAMSPQPITYLISFLTLGIFWNGQQAQLNHLARGDRNLSSPFPLCRFPPGCGRKLSIIARLR